MRLHRKLADIFFNAVARLLRAVSPSTEGQVGALRVMVVGDSISHGYEGYYTWRYRLWDWARSNKVAGHLRRTVLRHHAPCGSNRSDPAAFARGSRPSGRASLASGGSTPQERRPSTIDDHFAVWGQPGGPGCQEPDPVRR